MKKVIFDVDGVLLSEKRYFDVSALTLWEWYYSPLYLGMGGEEVHADLTEDEIRELRARFWKNDEILQWLKAHGINDNWDMVHAHIFVTLWLLLEEYAATTGEIRRISFDTQRSVRLAGIFLRSCQMPSAEDVLNVLKETVPDEAGKDQVFELLGKAAAESAGGAALAPYARLDSPLWHLHTDCFQNWYLGDTLYREIYGKDPVNPGKPGFLTQEEPLADPAAIKAMFQTLKARGYELAIATGRSRREVEIPFTAYDWLDEFDPLYVSTSTDVDEASAQLHQSLDKPNPFAYYLSAFGHFPDKYSGYVQHPEEFKKGTYYIVGDSLSDVLGARAMGAVMIGTLTGLDGEQARSMFEREGADYITDNVLGVLDILK